MASALDICNNALNLIGQGVVVSSIDPPEASIEAQLCARFWPLVRDKALEAYAWPFAVNRVALTDLTDTYPPPADYEFTYDWPSDCIRLIGVRDPESTDDNKNERMTAGASGAQRLIYSETENAVGIYIKRVTNATLFPPGLVTALEYMLASKLAGPIVKGSEGMRLSAELLGMAEREMTRAARLALVASAPINISDVSTYKPSWLQVRE